MLYIVYASLLLIFPFLPIDRTCYVLLFVILISTISCFSLTLQTTFRCEFLPFFQLTFYVSQKLMLMGAYTRKAFSLVEKATNDMDQNWRHY